MTFLDYGGKTQGLWNFAEAYMRDQNISPTFWSSPNNEIARFRVCKYPQKVLGLSLIHI